MTTGSTTWRDALVGEVQVRAPSGRETAPVAVLATIEGCAALAELTRWLARNAGRLDGL